MYPNLYYFLKSVFGVEVNAFKLVNTFGFLVAISFIVAAWVLSLELKRKQQLGLIGFTEEKIVVGASASLQELFINFLLGFVFGYKIIGAFFTPNALNDPQAFILSSQGNFTYGVLVGAIFLGLKWWEKNKMKLEKPEERIIRVWPHDRVSDIVFLAALFGFGGAKIFHNLENWNEFIADPIDALISFSGLTFYGGLICAGLAIAWYCTKKNIKVIHFADSIAPVMMLGYALGRIGCHISGDGDWGIVNSAFATNSNGDILAASSADFAKNLQTHSSYFIQQFKSLESVPHKYVEAFWGLPNWLFAYNYPHNVLSEGVAIIGCNEIQHCAQLPIPVFPTPLYEVFMCLFLFSILWMFRKKITTAGVITGLYLIFNGIERFLIEQIRVNTKYEDLPFQPTQAQLISLLMIVAGIIMLLVKLKFRKNTL
jgi:phosphatidylglycerol---prolipoprotein diacylglyceryl transferase